MQDFFSFSFSFFCNQYITKIVVFHIAIVCMCARLLFRNGFGIEGIKIKLLFNITVQSVIILPKIPWKALALNSNSTKYWQLLVITFTHASVFLLLVRVFVVQSYFFFCKILLVCKCKTCFLSIMFMKEHSLSHNILYKDISNVHTPFLLFPCNYMFIYLIVCIVWCLFIHQLLCFATFIKPGKWFSRCLKHTICFVTNLGWLMAG